MANRFQFDGGFEATVYRAAVGVGGELSRPRTRRTTLEEIAEEIIAEAQRIVDEPANSRRRMSGGLPGYGPGGRRNLQHDFRRSRQRGERTYRSSFDAQVEKRQGKLIVVAENTHDNADDVEYGTKRFGRVRSGGSKRIPLPITEAAYRRIQKSRNLSRSERRRRGWNSASSAYQKEQRARLKQLKSGQKDLKLSKGRRHSRSFPTRDGSGRPFLMVSEVRTWDRYAILQRAMRSVIRRRF